MSDRYLKNKSATETLNTLVGSDNFVISQTNLPNIDFEGVTSENGMHNHTFTNNTNVGRNVASGSNNTIAGNSTSTVNTGNAGNHTHTFTVPLGGQGVPVEYTPLSLIVNFFIYLGTN